MIRDSHLPLKPVEPDSPKIPSLAPAWVALVSVWLGLFMLIGSIALPFVPGSMHPRAELEHLQPYSLADRFLPIPIYCIAVTLFLAIVVLWQMRKEPRPLQTGLVNQRMQAFVAIALSLMAAIIVYTWIAFHGPRHG